ncbi:hypothetical protein ROHU_033177 [Labeo rohita]|uniref:Uncharacterized protein n=1 Tax=Labeo rohita TaxID=84645 RepID=A0A498LCB4_LABRO|nr:hypothetical protein ROHU_033149 [Labeo rohita]RXN05866.1 hypothetical protein ROHU_033177 [Labeo rohita]
MDRGLVVHQDHKVVAGLDCGAVDKTIDFGAVVGLDHGRSGGHGSRDWDPQGRSGREDEQHGGAENHWRSGGHGGTKTREDKEIMVEQITTGDQEFMVKQRTTGDQETMVEQKTSGNQKAMAKQNATRDQEAIVEQKITGDQEPHC